MNLRQENRSKLYFTATIITKYSLERFLSIYGEKMSKGFLKFCKRIFSSRSWKHLSSTYRQVYAFNSRLRFLIRGQFEFKILIARHINTTYFIWIKKYKIEPAIILKLVTCQRRTSNSSLMGRHLSPRYGQVILVSGYPVLTAVNWSQLQYQFSCAPSLRLNIGFPVMRTDGRCTVTWLPNFLGWLDLLSYGAPLARALRLELR